MRPSQQSERRGPRQFARRAFAAVRFFAAIVWIAAFAAPGHWADAAENAADNPVSKRTAQLLDEYGLPDLAGPVQPSPVLTDDAASRTLQAHVLSLRAQSYLARSRWELARPLLEQALALCPNHYGIQLSLADLDNRAFKMDRALETCDRLIKQYPNRLDAYELKGRILNANGKVDKAVALYKEALKRWPNCESLFRELLDLALKKGDFDLTIEIGKQRLEREPRHFHTLWILGYIYALKAQPTNDETLLRESVKFYEAAIEARPRFTKPYPRLAEVYQKLRERDRALATLRRGLIADPSDQEIRQAFERMISSDPKDPKILEAYRSLAEEYPASPDILEIYALQLLAHSRYAESRVQFARLLDLEPNNIKTLVALGGLELQSGEPAKAQEHFERAIALGADDVETYEAVGALYLRSQHYEQAIQLFEKALARDPKRPAVYFALAQAYQATNQSNKAADVLARGINTIPQAKNRKSLLQSLSLLQQQNKQYAEAVKSLRQAYEIDRADVAVFFTLAKTLLTLEDGDGFTKLVAQGRETFTKTSDEFQEGLALLLMDFHRYAEAVPELEALTKQHPDQWQYYSHLATAYQRLRQPANCERVYADARERLSKDPLDFWRFAARYHAMRYEHQKAFEALSKVLESASVPQTKEAADERFTLYESLFFNLGRLKKYGEMDKLLERAQRELGNLDAGRTELLRASALGEMKRFDESIALYRELIKKSPDAPRLFYEFGAVLNEAKQNAEAEKTLRQCLEMIPMPPPTSDLMDLRATVLNHLGYMFAEEGAHLEEAERLLTAALEIEPRAGFIVDSMGWLQFKLGNTDKALNLLKKAVDYSSEDPTLYDHLGDVYAGAGDRQKAVECWRQALRLDPDSPEIKAKLKKNE